MCVFKNTDQKNICTSIVFKAESRPKQEEKICKDFFPWNHTNHDMPDFMSTMLLHARDAR